MKINRLVFYGYVAISFVCYLALYFSALDWTSSEIPLFCQGHWEFLSPSDLLKEKYSSPVWNNTNSLSEVRNNNKSCEFWCRRGDRRNPLFFLSAVLVVRIYRSHIRLSSRELVQWLQYLRYAGVEHVYVYDAYVGSESQKSVLNSFIVNGYVTYVDWSAPGNSIHS